ncbi:hypothetical protein C6P40_002779 [Pichia californica]|uniref:SCP domain-containing protein n=1 Tax=Pichia californica TaxID=460514 RepID=A0A9P6WJB8_9ASCO|nr:hypothetical protein C6P40_002779 [[Candida] californica]
MKFSTSVISSIACLLTTVSASSVCSDATVTTYSTTYIPYITTTTSTSSSTTTTSSSSSSSSSTTSSLSSSSSSTTSSLSSSSSETSTTPSPSSETSTTSSSSSETSTTSTSSSPETSSSSTTTSSSSSSSPETTTSSSSSSSSSTKTSSSISTPSSTIVFSNTYLEKHNYYRSLMQDTNPVEWDDDIAAISQSYADAYTCDGSLEHSGNSLNGQGLGENLAYGYSYDGAGAVTAWFNEIALYNYSNPGFSEATGHFTQLVWTDTTKIGCGYKYCGTYYGYYIVCNYLPEGNIDLAGDTSYFYKLDVKEPKDDSTLAGGFPQ